MPKLSIREDVRIVLYVVLVIIITMGISQFVRYATGQTRLKPQSRLPQPARVQSIYIEEWFDEEWIKIRLTSGVEHVIRANSIDALVQLPNRGQYSLVVNGYSITLRGGDVDRKFIMAMTTHALSEVPHSVFTKDKKDEDGDSPKPPSVQIPDARNSGSGTDGQDDGQ